MVASHSPEGIKVEMQRFTASSAAVIPVTKALRGSHRAGSTLHGIGRDAVVQPRRLLRSFQFRLVIPQVHGAAGTQSLERG